MGADEECGRSDIAYYFNKNEYAPMTISPDSSFPVTNFEKGIIKGKFSIDFEKEQELPRIISIDSGYKTNVIPSRACAKIEGMTEKELTKYITDSEQKTGIHFSASCENNMICIIAEGVSTHVSDPMKGNNSITGLLNFITTL